MSVDFATFDISELTVLDATDAMGLPEMGASVIIELKSLTSYTPELDDMLGDIGAQAISSSSSSSSCCC